jgi:hypothetical protein
MGSSDLSTFRFLKILKPNTSMVQKIMTLNIQKDICIRSIHKKSLVKNTLYFSKYKKDKFLTKRYIILLLLYYYLLSEICLFYISKMQRIFNGIFLHTLLL